MALGSEIVYPLSGAPRALLRPNCRAGASRQAEKRSWPRLRPRRPTSSPLNLHRTERVLCAKFEVGGTNGVAVHRSQTNKPLTNDGVLQQEISNPKHKWPKTYVVQVEGTPTQDDIKVLESGVTLKDGITKPAEAEIIDKPEGLWDRLPPIRYRKSIPDSWLMITITEGRNRQVRRMTAAIGFPTLRLIRYSIGNFTIDDIPNGQWKQLDI